MKKKRNKVSLIPNPSVSSFCHLTKKSPLCLNCLHVITVFTLLPSIDRDHGTVKKNPLWIHRLLDEFINPNRTDIHLTVLYRWGLYHPDFDHYGFKNHMYFHFLYLNAAACETTKTKQWVLRASAFKSKILLPLFHIKDSGISLTVQWLQLSALTAMTTVQFLIRGLKYYKPHMGQHKNRDSMLLLWDS